jgi:hypothetical protein
MVDRSTETIWPTDYIDAINATVNRALSGSLKEALSTLSDIGRVYRSNPAFEGRGDELDRSILRNKMIAATLSSDSNVDVLIVEVLAEMQNSGIFDDVEVQFQKAVVGGKLRSL